MRRPRRGVRISLTEAWVMLVVTALGLVVMRVVLVRYGFFLILEDSTRTAHDSGWSAWGHGLLGLIATWLVSLTLIRFVPPRPRPRRLVRLPGLYPGLVLIAGIAAATGQAVGERPPMTGLHLIPGLFDHILLRFVGMSGWLALGFVGAWILLWAGDGWRPERSWIDGAGRYLGVTFVAIAAGLRVVG